jgi:hypothetical protein
MTDRERIEPAPPVRGRRACDRGSLFNGYRGGCGRGPLAGILRAALLQVSQAKIIDIDLTGLIIIEHLEADSLPYVGAEIYLTSF